MNSNFRQTLTHYAKFRDGYYGCYGVASDTLVRPMIIFLKVGEGQIADDNADTFVDLKDTLYLWKKTQKWSYLPSLVIAKSNL